MSTSKHFDKICCILSAVVLLATVLFIHAEQLGVRPITAPVGYVSGLFDASRVHTIDIVMDDWDSFIGNCADEEYADCAVVIDGEAYRNVAIRAKGNTSLTSVESYGNDRYSFKIEFDHYDDAVRYHGLDKLCLNNIIQDNTYMKDYLTYRLMAQFGADAPLCSYSYITVNGDDWGLYLAVEGVEDSFLQRNYGNDYGQLYKPDSMDMGGGRGNGRDFKLENVDADERARREPDTNFGRENIGRANMERTAKDAMSFDRAMGSADVSLIYTDDDFDSYANIFDNAKTSLSDADKTRLIESLRKLNRNEDIGEVVDVEEVIRYFVAHNFVLNFDSYTGGMIHNYYLHERDGQLAMIPWDYNLAFGGFESRTDAKTLVNYPIDTPVSGKTVEARPMLAWIFDSEEYTDLYHRYFAEFITEYFDSGYVEEMIASTKEMIAPYVESDPSKFCTYEKFEKGVSTLQDFCLLRAESISGQLDGTIPSTSEGQAQNSDALVNAEGLNMTDMGTMGNMMGGGFRKVRGTAVEAFNPMEGPVPSDMPSPPDGFTPHDGPMTANGFSPPDSQQTERTAVFIMMGISAGVLLIGIAAALLFPKRRYVARRR